MPRWRAKQISFKGSKTICELYGNRRSVEFREGKPAKVLVTLLASTLAPLGATPAPRLNEPQVFKQARRKAAGRVTGWLRYCFLALPGPSGPSGPRM